MISRLVLAGRARLLRWILYLVRDQSPSKRPSTSLRNPRRRGAHAASKCMCPAADTDSLQPDPATRCKAGCLDGRRRAWSPHCRFPAGTLPRLGKLRRMHRVEAVVRPVACLVMHASYGWEYGSHSGLILLGCSSLHCLDAL